MKRSNTIAKNLTLAAVAATALGIAQPGLAQAQPASILQIDVANKVLYVEDTSDVSQFATSPKATAPASAHGANNFNRAVNVADIVAVNGLPVKGTQLISAVNIFSSTAPTPGQAIADTVRVAVAVLTFEILKSDGTPIGTIVTNGFAGGAAPPGAPLTATGGSNFAITGGTGAFLGARGQVEDVANPPGVAAQRGASITEDPVNRRLNGGGTSRFVVHLIPMSAPQILVTSAGPAVTHSSDFALIASSKPAAAGEILSLFVSGLGPTVPAVDPGQPFPSTPLAVVNSPIEVKVNGTSAEVLGAAGLPGTVDQYQVNFRVPPGTAKGPASIQVSAAWISGAAISIPVQ